MSPRRSLKSGFTLVELLVVVSIIAVLIALLLPAMGKAQDTAKLVACSSQLKQWATAGFGFAAEHDGYFPRAFMAQKSHRSYPTDLNADETRDWLACGTPWSTFQQYGVTPAIAVCPTSSKKFQGPKAVGGDPTSDYGTVVNIGYLYLAGTVPAATQTQFPIATPALRRPIVPVNRTNDPGSAEHLLAADAVYLSRDTGVAIVNHSRSQTSDQQATAQNLLFGDGHAETRPAGYYSEPLSDQSVSLLPAAGSPNLFFWEGSPK